MNYTCEHCNKALKSIGTNRKNGHAYSANNGADWVKRRFHKKCLKEREQAEFCWRYFRAA